MRIVAVTACPTGIAHTYMAAESLEQAARGAGHEITVETQVVFEDGRRGTLKAALLVRYVGAEAPMVVAQG